MPLKAVFIDVGQTLLYEKPSRASIYAEAARARGRDVDEERMSELMGRAHAELPREIAGAYRYTDDWFRHFIAHVFRGSLDLAESDLAGLEDELFARFSDPTTFRFFPGAEELFDRLLERGLRVGVISNWSERLPRLLAALGIAERLDVLACSAILRAEKPDPEIFRFALAQVGVEPAEALHAGDHPRKDGEGARNVGLSAVLVDHEAHDSTNGLPVVHSLEELGNFVESKLV